MGKDNLIGRTTTIETGYCRYRTGTHVREAGMTIDLGKGIFGTATYLVVTIVDKHGKEHIGRIPDKNETRRVIKGSKRKE